MNRSFYLIILLLLISVRSFGQHSEKIDSLLLIIEKADNDCTKVDIYNEIGGRLLFVEEGSSFPHFNTLALNLSEQIGYKKGNAEALYYKGSYFLNLYYKYGGYYLDSANKVFLNLYENSQFTKNQIGIARGLNGLGMIQSNLHNHDSAIYLYKEGLEISLKSEDSFEIFLSIINLTSTYQSQKKYIEAINYYRLGFDRLTGDGNEYWRSILHLNLSSIYYKKEDYHKSIAHVDSAETLISNVDDLYKASQLYRETGAYYFSHGIFDQAIDSYIKSLRIAEKLNYQYGHSETYFLIGIIYRLQEEYLHARQYFQLALKSSNSDFRLAFSNYFIAYDFLKLNNLDSALHYYNEFLNYRVKEVNSTAMPLLIFKSRYELKTNQLDSASLTINKLLKEFSDARHHIHDYYEAHSILGEIHFQNKQYINSIESFNTALENHDKFNSPVYALEPLMGLSKSYEAIDDFENAYKYYSQYISWRDSLQNKNYTQKLKKLEFDNMQQKAELEHAYQINLEKKRKTIMIVVSCFLFVLLFTLFIYYRLKIKTNKRLRIKNEKILFQKKQLEILNQDKNKIIGMVAHDLRSPLNSIKGLFNVFRLEKEEKERAQYMDMISTSMERMTDMVNRVLDVSAIESKKLDLRYEVVNLHQLINNLLINFEQLAKKKNQTICLDSNGDNHLVDLDKNYFIQVLENLVSNAIKYSKECTTTTISLASVEKNVKISVKDEGPGIRKEEQDKLFKEFSTLSTKTTGGEKSTGLGLSIVKKYVESMKGKIWCESEMGKGSTFIIEFPMAS